MNSDEIVKTVNFSTGSHAVLMSKHGSFQKIPGKMYSPVKQRMVKMSTSGNRLSSKSR